MEIPEPQITVCPVVIERVIDADTFVLNWKGVIAYARLRDVWSAEISEQRDHPSEKTIGIRAAELVRQRFEGAEGCTAQFQTNSNGILFDAIAIGGRPAARIWTPDGVCVNEWILSEGLGFRTKQSLENYLTEQDREHYDAM